MKRRHLARATACSLWLVLSLAAGARAEGGDSTLIPIEEAKTVAPAEEANPEPAPPVTAGPAKPKPASRQARAAEPEAARTGGLKDLVERHAAEHGIPYGLAHAVIRIESRYNPGARNGPHLGLTQINARTAKALGYQGSASGLLDPDTNLRYGLKYLAQAYELAKGDTCATIQRYRGGHRSVTISKQTRVYCAKVMTITAEAR